MWNVSVSIYNWQRQEEKSGGGGLLSPRPATSSFLARVSFRDSSGFRNVFHSASVFIFPHLSLTLDASKSKGRRKRRGRDRDRRASLIRTKAQWTQEACGVSWPEARASSNMKDEWKGGFRELPLLVVWPGHNGAVMMQPKLIKTINKPQRQLRAPPCSLLKGKKNGALPAASI